MGLSWHKLDEISLSASGNDNRTQTRVHEPPNRKFWLWHDQTSLLNVNNEHI